MVEMIEGPVVGNWDNPPTVIASWNVGQELGSQTRDGGLFSPVTFWFWCHSAENIISKAVSGNACRRATLIFFFGIKM